MSPQPLSAVSADAVVAGSSAPATSPTTTRLLLVIPWELDAAGGVSQVAANLVAQARKDDRVDVSVFIRGNEHGAPVEQIEEGTRTIRGAFVSPWKRQRPLRSMAAALVRMPGNVRGLYRLLTRLAPDVVNVHYPGLSTWSLLLALRIACPRARVVLSFHGADLNLFEDRHPVTRFWSQRLVRSADVITCCSRALADRFSNLCAGTRLKQPVRVIHNGIDAERIHDELGTAALPDELRDLPPYVLAVGTFEHKKGHDVLLRAFATVRLTHPDLRLVLIGRPAEFLPELQMLIAALDLVGSVTLLQNVPHAGVLAAFTRARLFVLPSRIEPFGIVLLEAAYLGVPTIATAVGGVPEVVTHETGVLVPPDDPAVMAAAMASALHDGRLSLRMASAARQRVEQRFTWRAAFLAYLEAGAQDEGWENRDVDEWVRVGEDE